MHPTDERWWTAGRIDGNPSSLSSSCNRYRVVEGIADLIVVVPVEAVPDQDRPAFRRRPADLIVVLPVKAVLQLM